MSNELEKGIIKDQMKKETVFRAEAGNLFPWEFLSILSGNAVSLVNKWLIENGTPQEVVDLYQCLVILEGYSHDRKERELTEFEGSHLLEIVPEVTRLIAELGGTFCNGESISIARMG